MLFVWEATIINGGLIPILTILQLQSMIRAALTFHSPEDIYMFLDRNVGSLKMLVKKGQAIINFNDPHHNQLALEKYSKCSINSMMLYLTAYQEGDLERFCPSKTGQPEKPPPVGSQMAGSIVSAEPMVAQEPQDRSMDIEEPQPSAPSDPFDKIIRDHQKEMIGFLKNANVLVKTCHKKQNDIMEKPIPAEQKQKEIYQFIQYTKTALVERGTTVRKTYIKTRKHLEKFGGKSESIDVDVPVSTREVPQVELDCTEMQVGLQYYNQDSQSETKRVLPINESQFICTSNFIDHNKKINPGKLKVYSLDSEEEIKGLVSMDKTYGLLVIDKYIMFGTEEGIIKFINTSTEDEWDPEATQALHAKGSIFDILNFGTRNDSHVIATLGMDYYVKLWQISEDQVTNSAITLTFESLAEFNSSTGPIMSCDVLERNRGIVAASYQHVLNWDLESEKIVSSVLMPSNINKVKVMSQEILAVGHSNFISFADVRMKSCGNGVQVGREVKAVCVMGEDLVSYGCANGLVGLADRRRMDRPLWFRGGVHNSRVYDICRLRDKMISCDGKGVVVSWNPTQ